jgi:hypothetical protein
VLLKKRARAAIVITSDRSRSHEKGLSIHKADPGSLIATQAMIGCIKIQRVRGIKMNKALFAVVFLIGLGIAAAQTPPDPARQIEVQKEAMRRAARSESVKILGSPTLSPIQPVRILPPLKKMENK